VFPAPSRADGVPPSARPVSVRGDLADSTRRTRPPRASHRAGALHRPSLPCLDPRSRTPCGAARLSARRRPPGRPHGTL